MSGERQRPTALDCALRLITARPHFRAELRRKLVQRGYPTTEIEPAFSRLSEYGYLDDLALARTEVERLRTRKGLARSGLIAELRRKGAGNEAIESAIGLLAADDDDLALAGGRKWLRARPGRSEDAAALARHLARKGFGRRAIFRVLNELLPGAEPPSGLD